MQSSLEDRIVDRGGAQSLLYNSPGSPLAFPIAAEFSNWRDEQEAWRKSAIFQDMSFHMYDMLVEGPDVYQLLSDLGINSFVSFGPMQAKQYVVCNVDGNYVGDAILTCERENEVHLVGLPNVANWVSFHLEKGNYDAKIAYIDKPSPKLSERKLFRYQIQGPHALSIMEELNGGPVGGIGFFKMSQLNVGPYKVAALNHRMSGAPGFEIWGKSSVGIAVKKLIFEVGAKHGIRQIGGRNYPVTATESGWMGTALPAIYTGESTKSYRKWLSPKSFEANASIGGSLADGPLDDLYLTPYDMGYGFMIKFDHEFVGRRALESIAQKRSRKKVRLVWDAADAAAIQASMYGSESPAKFMELPVAKYSTFQMDEVLAGNKRVGISFNPVFSMNSRAWISLATLDEEYSKSGQSLRVTWGEPRGGSEKPSVERHVLKHVNVVVEAKAVHRD